eukprot:scaffold4003_cov125-Isochrysis_galbana.AAC.1
MGCAKASISGSTSGVSRLRRRWSKWNSPRDGRSAMLALDGTHPATNHSAHEHTTHGTVPQEERERSKW